MATVLITAGPTREHLDAVRFLTNGSTGRMGYALARAAHAAGHRTLLVSGPTELAPPVAETTRVVSALEMAAAVDRWLPLADVVFGVAAVSDYRPTQRHAGKPPRLPGPILVELVPNPDIIAGVGARAGRRAVVGFALEALDEQGESGVLARARRKLATKQLDAIVVNLDDALGAVRSQVIVLWATGREERWPEQDKEATAARLVGVGVELWQQKRS